MGATKPTWRPDEATDLLEQGYSPEHVAERTGLTVRQVRAKRKPPQTMREAILAAEAALETVRPARKPRKKPATKKAAAKKAAPKKSRRPRLKVVADPAEVAS